MFIVSKNVWYRGHRGLFDALMVCILLQAWKIIDR